MYSLIIVDYNTIDITTEYVARCNHALGKKGAGHVVIVENGTNDGIPEKLDALYGTHIKRTLDGIAQPVYCYETDEQQIIYCHSGENMGYARGNNLGMQIASAYFDDKYYIISNNDVVFPEAVDLAKADRLFAAHPEIGILGPRVTTPAGERQSPYVWQTAFQRLILFYWKPLLRLIKKAYDPLAVPEPATGPCDWIIGCFILARAEAIQAVDMFDGNTFLYAEELILSRRLVRKGYSTWYCPELSVVHQHAQTTKKALSSLRAKDINFQSIYYYYKNYTDTSAAVLFLSKINYWCHRTLFWCTHKMCELLNIKSERK